MASIFATVFFFLLAAILGFLYWKFPRHPKLRLSWSMSSSVSLVTEEASKIPSLDVRYRGQPLDRVTMWVGKLWNSSPAPIREEDLRDLRFEIEDAQILGAWLQGYTSIENGVTAITDLKRNVVEICFDFLNSGQGASFGIIHDGSDETMPRLSGTVVGGSITNVVSIPDDREPRIAVYSLSFLVFLVSYIGFDVWATERASLWEAVQNLPPPHFIIVGAATLCWLVLVWGELRIRAKRGSEPTHEDLQE